MAVTSDTTVNIYAYLGSTSLPSAAITVTPSTGLAVLARPLP